MDVQSNQIWGKFQCVTARRWVTTWRCLSTVRQRFFFPLYSRLQHQHSSYPKGLGYLLDICSVPFLYDHSLELLIELEEWGTEVFNNTSGITSHPNLLKRTFLNQTCICGWSWIDDRVCCVMRGESKLFAHAGLLKVGQVPHEIRPQLASGPTATGSPALELNNRNSPAFALLQRALSWSSVARMTSRIATFIFLYQLCNIGRHVAINFLSAKPCSEVFNFTVRWASHMHDFMCTHFLKNHLEADFYFTILVFALSGERETIQR